MPATPSTELDTEGWQVANTLEFEGDSYSSAKPLIDAEVKKYHDAGFAVQIVAQPVRLDILIRATDA